MTAPGNVELFTEENFKGEATAFPVGTMKHIITGGPLNKKFHSLRLGDGTKFLTWNHSDGYDTVEWPTKPSLEGTDYYECFSVLKGDTHIIGVKFKDATGGSTGQYSLIVKCADLGTVTLQSNKDDKFSPVGSMPLDGHLVTTAIYVRDMKTGVYIATGSIYFALDEKQNVKIDDETGFPPQLKHEQEGASNFVITLISNKPSE